MSAAPTARVDLMTIAREWGRIGVIGFGGPPAHIALLRKLCVVDRQWLDAGSFENAIAAVNLLPGPASTQLAIFCAWQLRGTFGALVGGVAFIVPGLVIILGLSALFLAAHTPLWVAAAAAGAGAAVPAVAAQAAMSLIPASWRRVGERGTARMRWGAYLVLGGAAGATIGPYLVVVLLACGLAETATKALAGRDPKGRLGVLPVAAIPPVTIGGLGALAWVAFKVVRCRMGEGSSSSRSCSTTPCTPITG